MKEKKTYLVTGGAGFIGTNFIKYLFEKYKDSIRVINLDKLTYAGNRENLASEERAFDYVFVRGDICSQDLVRDVFRRYEIHRVVHFAAESHVDRSIADPGVFVQTNVFGTQNLLEEAKQVWETGEGHYKSNRKFLHVSTDEVFGSLGSEGKFTEESPYDPHSPYAASKAGADLLVKSYVDTYGFPALITNCSNNYGPYQHPEKLIPHTICTALKGQPVPVYGDGRNVRDWLYVGDHARALDLVLEQGKIGTRYNIGGGSERKNQEIVETILRLLRSLTLQDDPRGKAVREAKILYTADRKGHDRRYAVDYSRIQKELGWEPERRLEEGLEETVKWYLKRESWMEEIGKRDKI